jgi:aryl-alcohol dehydrogenase-like predicted oxidoreductase
MPDSAVRTVPLGSTGIKVSEFFFGGAAIGGIGSAPSRIGLGMKTDEALERLDEAYEIGIRVLDTANSFASGESERVIGRWREERERADVLVSTKVGNVVERGQETISLAADHIGRQLALSRSRLGTVDLYLAHGFDVRTPLEETITALAAAIDTEQIRAWGCSTGSVRVVEAWLLAADRAGLPRPGWVQSELSLVARSVERDLLPLAGGVLSARYLGEDPEELPDPAPGSRLALAPAMYAAAFTLSNLARVAGLESIARERDVGIPALALAWLRWHPQVTATIVSPRRTEQWDAVTDATSMDFDDALAEQVGALFA